MTRTEHCQKRLVLSLSRHQLTWTLSLYLTSCGVDDTKVKWIKELVSTFGTEIYMYFAICTLGAFKWNSVNQLHSFISCLIARPCSLSLLTPHMETQMTK